MLISTNSSTITEIPERYSLDISMNQDESNDILKKLEGLESKTKLSDREIIVNLLKQAKSGHLDVSDDFLLTINQIKLQKSDKPKNNYPKPTFKKKKTIEYKF